MLRAQDLSVSDYIRLSESVAFWLVGGITGSASDQQSTNDRKVAGSRPTKVVHVYHSVDR